MNVNDFSNILKNPQGISFEQIREITSILEEYPYFQAARALHLKILYAQKDYKYNRALKVAAAHITNRTVLYNFINCHKIQIKEENPISRASITEHFSDNSQKKSIAENYKNDENWIIPSEKTKNISSSKIQKRSPSLVEPMWFLDINVVPENVSQGIAESLKPTSNHNQETNNNTSEKINSSLGNNKLGNLSDYSQNPHYDRVVDGNQKKSNREDVKNKFELIDRFLEVNPKIEPSKDYESTVDLAEKNSIDTHKFMTETLAKVYLRQQKFEQAIEAYEILILKNPKKSAFFADQIRAIKNLQQNNL